MKVLLEPSTVLYLQTNLANSENKILVNMSAFPTQSVLTETITYQYVFSST